MSDVDRRKYARLDLKSKVEFAVVEGPGVNSSRKKYCASGKNIGAEGILVSSEQELAPGTVLDMDIFLAGRTEPVRMQGEVRWCRSVKLSGADKALFDTGIKFTTINKNHVRLMVQYVCGKLSGDRIQPAS